MNADSPGSEPVRADGASGAVPAPDGDPASWYLLPPDQWAAARPAPAADPLPHPVAPAGAPRRGLRSAPLVYGGAVLAAVIGLGTLGPAVVRDLRLDQAPAATIPPTLPGPTTPAPPAVVAPEKAVYLITVDGCGLLGTGSGFALDEHHVVTNAHVVVGDAHPQLRSFTGERYVGTVVGVHRNNDSDTLDLDGPADVAVIQVDVPLQGGALHWSPSPVAAGEQLRGTTFPKGVFTPTTGTVVEPARQGFWLDGAFDHGSSGGPVTTADGGVAGLVSAKNFRTGHTFAFDAAVVAPVVAAILADPHPGEGDCPSS
jgi:S1-C subfamily serine protease